MRKLSFNRIYSYLVNGVITGVIVLTGMLVIKHQMPPKLVKIDLVAITTHYTQLMMKDAMGNTSTDNAAIQKLSDAIKLNLEPTISEFAKSHNVVVIQAQALVDTNTPDITNQIIEQLDGKLK